MVKTTWNFKDASEGGKVKNVTKDVTYKNLSEANADVLNQKQMIATSKDPDEVKKIKLVSGFHVNTTADGRQIAWQ